MAEIAPGFVAGTYPANVHRMIHAAMFIRSGATGGSAQAQARSGILGYKSLRVTATTGLTLSVSSGVAVVQGSGAQQGAYVLVNAADDTVTLNTANATLARKDAIIARVFDTTDGVPGGGHAWVIDKVTGDPSASPVLPALPLDCILLAEVNVLASATTISAGNITDRRTYTAAAGGVLSCTSTTLPPDPAPGQLVWLSNNLSLDVWDGTAYRRLYGARTWTDMSLFSAWRAYDTSQYPTLGYSISGDIVIMRGIVKSIVSTGDDAVIAQLPVGARPSYRIALSLYANSTTVRVDLRTDGAFVVVRATSALANLVFDQVLIPLGG